MPLKKYIKLILQYIHQSTKLVNQKIDNISTHSLK